MKRQILTMVAIALFAILPVYADAVQISEVLFDPYGTESGGEAIELYNPTTTPINIGLWTIKSKSSEIDATIPEGTVLLPKHYFLLADEGWTINRDDSSYPLADYEEALSLTNTNAGIALLRNGEIIDAVGWGDKTLIPLALFQTDPAPNGQEGFSLQRVNSTFNNSYDFIYAEPSFKNASFEETNTGESSDSLSIEVEIAGQAPKIQTFTVDTDDLEEPGSQIFPQPQTERLVQISAKIEESDGIEDISSVTLSWVDGEKELAQSTVYNGTAALFTTTLTLPSTKEAGLYGLSLLVQDKENKTAEAQTFFEYKELMAIQLNADLVSFETMEAGTTKRFNETEAPLVMNEGNVPLSLGAFGELSETNSSLSYDWLKISFDGETFFQLAANPTMTEAILLPGNSQTMAIELSVPEAVERGTYEGVMTVLGVKQ